MDKIIGLIALLPLPIVLHDKSKVIIMNTSFQALLTQAEDLDFIQWLTEVCKAKELTRTLVDAIQHCEEISVDMKVYIRGTQRSFRIFSSPLMSNEQSSENMQLTFFQDLSLSETIKSYWALQLRVSKATMQLVKEVEARKKSQEIAALLNNQLVDASRRAGMADVAESVLHNVGNVLNTVNVSASLVMDTLSQSQLKGLTNIKELITKHKENFGEFITTTPQGSRLPEYLSLLADCWEEERNHIFQELNLLIKNIQHINMIVNRQQALTRVPGLIDTVIVSELLEDALTINEPIYKSSDIEIIRDYEFTTPIEIDKASVLQIITNLIRNAIESLLESHNQSKRLILRTQNHNSTHLTIQVMDNGVGIAPENLIKIFSLGFTTKKSGHGFGLHTSALAAHEMKGKLSVTSDGLDKGADFTLLLPIKATSNMQTTELSSTLLGR